MKFLLNSSKHNLLPDFDHRLLTKHPFILWRYVISFYIESHISFFQSTLKTPSTVLFPESVPYQSQDYSDYTPSSIMSRNSRTISAIFLLCILVRVGLMVNRSMLYNIYIITICAILQLFGCI